MSVCFLSSISWIIKRTDTKERTQLAIEKYNQIILLLAHYQHACTAPDAFVELSIILFMPHRFRNASRRQRFSFPHACILYLFLSLFAYKLDGHLFIIWYSSVVGLCSAEKNGPGYCGPAAHYRLIIFITGYTKRQAKPTKFQANTAETSAAEN